MKVIHTASGGRIETETQSISRFEVELMGYKWDKIRRNPTILNKIVTDYPEWAKEYYQKGGV
jgi:hypothetical protein